MSNSCLTGARIRGEIARAKSPFSVHPCNGHLEERARQSRYPPLVCWCCHRFSVYLVEYNCEICQEDQHGWTCINGKCALQRVPVHPDDCPLWLDYGGGEIAQEAPA